MGIRGGSPECFHNWSMKSLCIGKSIFHKINPRHRATFGAIWSQRFAKKTEKTLSRLNLIFLKIYFIPLHRFRWLPTFWILSHIFRTKIKEVLPPSRRKWSECRSFYRDPISRFVPKTLYKCIWSISYHRNKKVPLTGFDVL